MSKFLELQCCECEAKKKFVDAKDVSFQKWRIIGWNVGTTNPIVACDKCVLPWEKPSKTEYKKSFDPIDVEEEDKKISKPVKKKKTKNEKKRISKRNKSTK